MSTKCHLLAVLLLSQSLAAFAGHGHGNEGNPHETLEPDVSMVSLPIHIGFDGGVSWGYGPMDHGSMGHSSMDHDMHTDMDMDHDMNSDMDMDHDMHSDMDMDHDMHSDMDMDHDMHSDMDMDQEMNSDMDHDSSEQESNTNMSHSKSGWMWMVMPMLHIGADYYKRVINLASSNSTTVKLDDSSAGYQVVENKSIQLGGGPMIMGVPPGDIPFGGLIHAGIMPYKGGHIFRTKSVKTLDQTRKSLKDMNTPQSLEDISSWSVRDGISYSTMGGVMYSAGIGVDYISNLASVGYMAQGTWITSIAKASRKHVLVSIKKSKMKMLMGTIGLSIVSMELHKFKNADKNFNFTFDLTNTQALDAYKEMIKGNVLLAQELSLDSVSTGVKQISFGHSSTSGKMRSRRLRIPVLYNNQTSTGTMSTQSYSENFLNNTQMTMEMGMYNRSRKTNGIMSNHTGTGFIFMAGAHKMTGEVIGQERSVLGSFKWYFQNGKSSTGYIKNRFGRAVEVMGLDKLNDIDLSELKGAGALKFVRGEIDIALTDSFTRSLVSQVNDKQLKTNLKTSVEMTMDNYFSSQKNVKLFCSNRRLLQKCMLKLRKKTLSAIKKIPTLISKMSKTINHENKKEFVKLYTRLGQLMLTNRFVFQEVMSLVKDNQPRAILSLQGTRISNTKVKL